MIRVLDLFAGTQSVRKALEEKYCIHYGLYKNGVHKGYSNDKLVIEYIGLDIYSPEGKNLHFDLTQDNIVEKLKEVLPTNGKPDFIGASPLCTTFSRAAAVAGGNLYYEYTNETDKTPVIRQDWNITHKAYAEKAKDPQGVKGMKDKAQLGMDLMNNTIKIIKHYNVPFAIENPANAMSRYLMKGFTRNITEYCRYGFLYKKSTAIYSNKEINLLRCNHKGNHEQVMSGGSTKTGIKNAPSSNQDRSKVPPKLIKEILEQLLEGENNEVIKD